MTVTIKENLERIYERMAAAAVRAGRKPDSVRLVAVSKRMPVECVREAADCGQLVFGENYVQEAEAKIIGLGAHIAWHFIGHLQSNKAKTVAELFHVVETVDRLKLARALDKHSAAVNKILTVYIQVNIGGEPQKSGVMPDGVEQLLENMSGLRHVKVKGLMAMPPFLEDPEEVRPYFRKMRQLAGELQKKGLLRNEEDPVELSMGMSGDFEVAIEEGATLVRVGTAIFGPREAL